MEERPSEILEVSISFGVAYVNGLIVLEAAN